MSRNRAKPTTSPRESTTLVDRIERERLFRGSARSQAVHPLRKSKKGAKQAATTSSVAKQICSARPMGLAHAAESRESVKRQRQLWWIGRNESRRRKKYSSEIESLPVIGIRRMCRRTMCQDRALLEKYVADTKVRITRALAHGNRQGLTQQTLPAMTRLLTATADTSAVSTAARATPNVTRTATAS